MPLKQQSKGHERQEVEVRGQWEKREKCPCANPKLTYSTLELIFSYISFFKNNINPMNL